MSWRLTVILALVLALLGGYYAYFEMKVFPQRKQAEEEAKKIFAIKAEEIKEISLQRKDTEILCVRDNGGWKMLKPVKSDGDGAALEKMASILEEAKYEKILDKENPDLKHFGLEPPSLQVWVTKKDGTTSRKLALGGKSPTDKYVYARLDQGKNIFFMPAKIMDDLDKNVFDFRSKRLLDIKPEEVDGLEVSTDSWRVVAHRVDKQKWAMVAPLDAPAQSSKINALLRKLTQWQVKEFISERADDLATYGLEKPSYTIHVKAGKASSQQVLMLGNKDETKNGVFAHMKGATNVVMLDAKIMEDLPREAFDLREKDFIVLQREKVEKIRLTYPQRQILLAKEDKNHWVIEEPSQLRADYFKVRNLLLDADDMEITQFIDADQPSPEESGLDAPAVRAEFWIEGEKEPVGVELGRNTEDGKAVYARQIRKNRVDMVDVKNVERLTKTVFDLRFRKLLEFDNKDIESIQMTLAGKEFEVHRDGNKWKMTRPEKKDLKSGQVFSFLWALKDLEFKEVVSEDGKNVPSEAFEKIRLKVKLIRKNDSSPGTLVIGDEIPDKKGLVYGRVEGRPLVAAVEAGLINRAQRALEKAKR
ncbi:MAG: DUF4340 domain-containing protein [Deltaproteobacteria bacterium]|nr:DUF4340 domain-containing protein [Deltaproteobacteria bacterium]